MTAHREATGTAQAAPVAARVRHARTWLLRSPLAAGGPSGADVVVLDLEDGLPASRKEEGRQHARRHCVRQPVWLRVSAAGTPDGDADLALAAELGPGLAGIMLAMCASAADLDHVDTRLAGGVPVVAMIETAAALLAAPAIAAHPRTSRLAFGIGDFRRDTGMSADPVALAWPRAQLTVASAAAGLPGPIDGPCGAVPQARAAAAHAASVGFTGTLVLDAAAVAGAHAAFTPAPADLARAYALLADSPPVDADGSYAPALARARALVARAEALAAL
ncbi:aldolase/citrate lyase family protein [Microbacterium sp. NPDC091313]